MSRRLQDEKDIERLIELGRQMHAESRYADLPFDEDHIRRYCIQSLHEPEKIGIFIEANVVRVTAAIALFRVPYYFAPSESYASDFMLYVAPDKRGGRGARNCLKRAERWAREHGMREILLGITAGIDDVKAERFYAIHGYRPLGRFMMKEVS